MEKFAKFLEQTGFNWIGVLAMAIFGYLIVGNLIRQLKVVLLASSMDNALVNFVLTFARFLLLLAFCCSFRVVAVLFGPGSLSSSG